MAAEIVNLAEVRAMLRPYFEATPEERKAIARDPDAHKLTTIMASGDGLKDIVHWWTGLLAAKSRPSRAVAYCWTAKRNAAGYFLGWREVHEPGASVKRDGWTARRQKKALVALQMGRGTALKAKGWTRTTKGALARKAKAAKAEEVQKRRGAVMTAARSLCGHVKGSYLLQAGDNSAGFMFVDRYGRRFRVSVIRAPGDGPL